MKTTQRKHNQSNNKHAIWSKNIKRVIQETTEYQEDWTQSWRVWHDNEKNDKSTKNYERYWNRFIKFSDNDHW